MIDAGGFFARFPASMTVRTRNRLITFSILAGPFVFFLGLLLFWDAEPLPPIPPLPNPNGYEDLVKAGQMITGKPENYEQMNQAQLGKLIDSNTEPLELLHAALTNQCRVPLQFTQVDMDNLLNELARFKRLAQLQAAQGRLAEMNNHPGVAARSYLEIVNLGIKSTQGGMMLNQLVGIAIEKVGTGSLQKIVDRLDVKSCRETAGKLEALDAQRQTWSDVLQHEHDWSRRAFTGLRNELTRVISSGTIRKSEEDSEQAFKKHELKTRQLIIDLAARAYELDKGHRPPSVADLVPDYLKAVPQDPITGTNMVYSP
jgi:hypothetical protein